MHRLLSRMIVSFAYMIEGSTRYRKIKNFFFNLLENDDYPYKKYFDIFMIVIILSSVFILVIEVREAVPKWLDDFDLYFVTAVFITEYLLRMWVFSDLHTIILNAEEESRYLGRELRLGPLFWQIVKDKWRYVTSPAAIIDLIAILPSYREIRVLRILVLFRAFKMLRYAKSLGSFIFILKNKKFELLTLMLLTLFFVFIAGIMLYVFEGAGHNDKVHNLFDAFYWALVTISTVGYGDITPVTAEGRFMSMLIIVTGLGLISFATSVIVSSFSERLMELRDERVVQEVQKKKNITVVCGYGIMGQKVAEGLRQAEKELIVIDEDEEKAQLAHKSGFRTICADAARSVIFERIGLEKISHVLCLTADDEQNAFIAVNVKSLDQSVHVTARCSDREIAEKLTYAKIDKVVVPEEITAMMGSVYAGEPVAFEAVQSILAQEHDSRIDEVEIEPSSFFEGKTIEDLQMDEMRLVLLGVVRRVPGGGRRFIFRPDDTFVLMAGDHIVFMGRDAAIAHFKKRLLR
jgi:voltage-gated potassium channel